MPPVLIVDDDRDIRDSFRYLLEAEGYAVLTAMNGKDALDVLQREGRPCIILLDLLMPVMDGIEFLAEMGSLGDLSTIPVVVISAASTVPAPDEVAFLQKPVSVDKLFNLVGKHCGLPHERDAHLH